MSEGNTIAYMAIVLWPILSLIIYSKKSIPVAILWVILGGYMFLPVHTYIDFPMIPPLGKGSIATLAVILGLRLVRGKKVALRSSDKFINGLFYLFLLSPLVTTMLNADSINIGGRYLEGMAMHDAFSIIVNNLIYILPFFIGRQFFRSYDSQLTLFKTLLYAGVVYSFLILFEIRMSPQLHSWLYGYFPHDFRQQMRAGGFRSVAFMGHGLLVSFFVAITLISICTLWKSKISFPKISPKFMTFYMALVLFFCKSTAALVYGLFSIIAIINMNAKKVMFISVMLVSLALLYPAMSIFKVFPHQAIVEVASDVNEERARSLQFRFDNEAVLLAHARERLYFGWGGWGRNRVFEEETGEDLTVTDGRWIITFGQFGMLGFLAEFGLLAFTVLIARRASKKLKAGNEYIFLAAHALMVAITMIDQLPNSSLAPWLWLIAGALLGRSEDIIQTYTKSSLRDRRLS